MLTTPSKKPLRSILKTRISSSCFNSSQRRVMRLARRLRCWSKKVVRFKSRLRMFGTSMGSWRVMSNWLRESRSTQIFIRGWWRKTLAGVWMKLRRRRNLVTFRAVNYPLHQDQDIYSACLSHSFLEESSAAEVRHRNLFRKSSLDLRWRCTKGLISRCAKWSYRLMLMRPSPRKGSARIAIID